MKELKSLSPKEYSKKCKKEERDRLAQEIRKKRKERRDELMSLKKKIKDLELMFSELNIDWNQLTQEYQALEEERNKQVNSFFKLVQNIIKKAGIELKKEVKINKKIKQTEQEKLVIREEIEKIEDEISVLKELVDNDNTLEVLRKKIEEHYLNAEQEKENIYQEMGRGLKNTISRNKKYFFVHNIDANIRFRETVICTRGSHELSCIENILALEPNIPCSSIEQGKTIHLFNYSEIYHDCVGVILGEGKIEQILDRDAGTIAASIDSRGRFKDENGCLSNVINKIKTIDDCLESSHTNSNPRYNEICINHAKITGIFKILSLDENGNFVFKGDPDIFKKHFDWAGKNNIPFFVLQENDGRLFELKNMPEIAYLKPVIPGKEIQPEDVLEYQAGVSTERRIEMGKRILRKKIFHSFNFYWEAKKRLRNLMGEKEKENPEISDYIEYVKETDLGDINEIERIIRHIPIEIHQNKEFVESVFNHFANDTNKVELWLAMCPHGDIRWKDSNFVSNVMSVLPDSTKESNVFWNRIFFLQDDDLKYACAKEYIEKNIENADRFMSFWRNFNSSGLAKQNPQFLKFVLENKPKGVSGIYIYKHYRPASMNTLEGHVDFIKDMVEIFFEDLKNDKDELHTLLQKHIAADWGINVFDIIDLMVKRGWSIFEWKNLMTPFEGWGALINLEYRKRFIDLAVREMELINLPINNEFVSLERFYPDIYFHTRDAIDYEKKEFCKYGFGPGEELFFSKLNEKFGDKYEFKKDPENEINLLVRKREGD